MDRQASRVSAVRAAAGSASISRDLGLVAGGAQCIERVAQGVLDLTGVHQLAQQRVHQPGQHEPVAATATAPLRTILAAGLVVRSEQLARSEEERRRVLAARHDDVVGGILEPGAQPAGQPGIEARASGGVATQQRQDLGPRAAVRGRSGSITRRGRLEQRTWCDEDHRCSVPTGCDTPLTPHGATEGWLWTEGAEGPLP